MSDKEKSNKGNIKIGDRAPDFTLDSQSGDKVRLKDFIGKKIIVLYFYPKDGTPGCTAEACSFRDNYDVFKNAGAEVIGISSDAVESHSAFVLKYNLQFILLSDKDQTVRKLYGVPSTLGLLPGRVTYIIDKKGIVRHVFSSQFNATKHISEALRVIQSLTEEKN
ncbi:MAG: peroxiredoxin [Deltaproteobacteria bacterium]|nr:peroxiredoxin [Deltaproteobacteria bacterium]